LVLSASGVLAVAAAQEATPKAQSPTPNAPAPLVNPIDGAELAVVPAGEFKMGSTNGQEDEKPVHPVKLAGFRISKTEVTNEQYGRFMAATGHREPMIWKERRFNGPKQPVVGVDWDDAAAYAKWAGGRLPTEAEWEYAARGSDGREFPWSGGGGGGRGGGRGMANRAVVDLQSNNGKAAEVGSMKEGASPCGALDMAGNVWEWCADWYGRDYYAHSPAENPKGPAEGTQRMLRGGSWGYPSNVRSAFRVPERPDSRSPYVGFRYVQDLPAN
jgi:formylglycine-generating enzyme required for sulfatase activity